jgi:hypothetical protein
MNAPADGNRVRGTQPPRTQRPRANPAVVMAVWETESRSWGGLVQPLSSHAKRVLCLDAIDLCLASFRPSPEQALGAPTARLARRALDLLRERAGDPSPGEPAGEFLDSLRALGEGDHCAAAGSVITALTEYADAMPAALDASNVFVVMSACYEAVRRAERTPRATAAEHGNQTLRRLITAQRRLIDAAVLA